MPMMRVPIYILAGGKSSRFGSDKARAVVAGQPNILRLARLLEPMTDKLTVVADVPGKYADLGLRTIADANPGLGPMGGLQTALDDAASEEWLLLIACDLLSIDPGWIDLLSEGLFNNPKDTQAVAFRGQFPEPLFALYHHCVSSLLTPLPPIEERSLHQLLGKLRTCWLPLPINWPQRSQFNRREDLQEMDQ